MDFTVQYKKFNRLMRQRHHASIVIACLFVLCFIQLFIIIHLTDDQTSHFTPVPQVITAPFSISRNQVSASYLADMTRYFAMLRLNYTPATIESQSEWLLRYTDGNFYGSLKQLLASDIQQAKEHDISLSFSPVDTRVNSRALTVTIDGDLIRYVGKARLPIKRVCYEVTYRYQNGNLRITAMKALPLSHEKEKAHA